MAAGLSLTLEGDTRAELALGRLAHAVEDRGSLLDVLGQYLESATIERFDREEGPDGQAWDKSIRAREEGGKTLNDDGYLKGSITHNVRGDTIEVGTNLIYGGVHQFGATIKAKNADRLAFFLPGGLGFVRPLEVEIPARPYLGIGAEDEEALIAEAQDEIARQAEWPA